MTPLPEALAPVEAFVRGRMRRAAAPLLIGLCGAQGSGKSTLAAELARRIDGAVVLSLDDLYLTLAERERLADEVHPLLRTRGVPGTHDVTLGLEVIGALRRGEPVRLPRFDKATDDRVPQSAWPLAQGASMIIFEGWCVGARPQAADALAAPMNELERREDAGGTWRRHVNDALRDRYQALFALDALVMLAAPGFDVVRQWRTQQEHDLAAQIATGLRSGHAMTDAEVARFVQFYERLTCHMLHEMPQRADLTVRLDERRRVIT